MMPYKGYCGGFSYGPRFHFQWETVPGGGAVVFNIVDGAIWAKLPADKNINGYDFSLDAAAKLCLAWNGISGVDLAAV